MDGIGSSFLGRSPLHMSDGLGADPDLVAIFNDPDLAGILTDSDLENLLGTPQEQQTEGIESYIKMLEEELILTTEIEQSGEEAHIRCASLGQQILIEEELEAGQITTNPEQWNENHLRATAQYLIQWGQLVTKTNPVEEAWAGPALPTRQEFQGAKEEQVVWPNLVDLSPMAYSTPFDVMNTIKQQAPEESEFLPSSARISQSLEAMKTSTPPQKKILKNHPSKSKNRKASQSPDEGQRKLELRRLKNRINAQKARDRKTEELKSLEAEAGQLQQRVDSLKKEIASTKASQEERNLFGVSTTFIQGRHSTKPARRPSFGLEGLTPEEKRQRRLIKNRESAHRSRERKKEYHASLTATIELLKKQLQLMENQLKRQLATPKRQAVT